MNCSLFGVTELTLFLSYCILPLLTLPRSLECMSCPAQSLLPVLITESKKSDSEFSTPGQSIRLRVKKRHHQKIHPSLQFVNGGNFTWKSLRHKSAEF